MRTFPIVLIVCVTLCVGIASRAPAQATDDGSDATTDSKNATQASDISAVSGATTTTSSTAQTAKPTARPKYPPHTVVLKDFEAEPGLITTYRKGNRMYFELSGSQYSREFMVVIAIAKGIGRGNVLGGMTWSLGDDWIWKFRKVDDRVHIVRRNVRFRATKGKPQSRAVEKAYTDSVLYSLPVVTRGPRGGDIIDVTSVFMSDLPQISSALPGFGFSPSKSTWASVKGFPGNIELEVAATYASSGRLQIAELADSRGATVNVHYSISAVPQTGYRPRLADDRVGYFLSVVKDFSKKTDRDRFVRYINRWDLKKAEPSVALSEPAKPIIFYIEKTVPFKYRKPIRDGIMEWNKAFEKAGFIDAIQVRQQEDSATWDPEDIRYNTFRWITAGAAFAMGPSRVNPYTGQILDADIILDADFIQYWKSEYETFTAKSIAAQAGAMLNPVDYKQNEHQHVPQQNPLHHQCMLSSGLTRHLALGSAALLARADAKETVDNQEKMIMQAIKDVAMHEVGHTLGLRHNFKGSAMLKLDKLHNGNGEDGHPGCMVGSVMDYTPAHIVPKDEKQGDFFATTIGPYDYWAIEYGYKPNADLKKIAARSGEPGLAYAPDEDVYGINPDPDAALYDLGDDTVAYAKLRARLVDELMPKLHERVVKDGESYEHARRTFNVLLSTHGDAMYSASRYIGGLSISRSHKGDKDAKPPFSVVDPKKQREALELINQNVFSGDAYQYPPEVYSYLAPTKWDHWGVFRPFRPDYPVHDYIALFQDFILSQVFSPNTLDRIHDNEIKVPADEDAFTTAELIEGITQAIFSETETVKEGDYTNRKPAISSLRRNLQRTMLRRLSNLAMGNTFSPEDCQTLAYSQLSLLEGRMQNLLKSNKVKLDSYSRAHLEESSSRIRKVLDAKLTLYSP